MEPLKPLAHARPAPLAKRRAVSGGGLFDALLALTLAGAGACTVIGYLGSVSWIADLFAHFRLYYALALGAAAAAFAARRRFLFASAAGAALAMNLVSVAPLYLAPSPSPGPTPPSPAPGAAPFSILHYNVHTANPRRVEALRHALDSNAELVFLIEIGPEWSPLLEGLAPPYRVVLSRPSMDNFGMALLARVPVREARVANYTLLSIPTIEASVPWDGDEWLVIGVHTLPPVDEMHTGARDLQLDKLAERVRRETRPVAVVGDLNATLWSSPYARFVERSGLTDASLGRGYRATWSSGLPFLRIPIDQSLHSAGLTAISREVGGDPIGSDHFPVLVKLARISASRK